MYPVRAKGFLFLTMTVCGVLPPFLPAQSQSEAIPTGFLIIDLKNALERARDNSRQLQSATLDMSLAREDRIQAKTTLLPSLDYFNQYIYTQGNGTPSGIFVGNDGIHVYNSQVQVHQELFSPVRLTEYRRSIAAQSLAAAKRAVVERGVVAATVQNYYAVLAAERKSRNAQQSLEEAQHFVDLTEKLEQGGEVAHADVLKAQLAWQQRQRDFQDSRLAVEKARIELAVLLFPDYRVDFKLVDDLNSVAPLPTYSEIETAAKAKSPELRAAEENIRQEEFGVKIARAAYLPTFSVDYLFGINANQLARLDPEGNNRLGSVAQATLNIPVWNWGTMRSKVRQADLKRRQAQLDLELSHQQLIAQLHSIYLEAQATLSQLDSLQRSMEVAAESLRLTNLRYAAGEVSVLEVVDAQATLLQARNALDDGLLRYRLALAGIRMLTGTILL